MEDHQEEVIRNLRSCLISCKGGIKLENLRADYRMVAGEQLPFKQFGYNSLEAFIHSIPNVSVTRKNGELYVEAAPSKTSAHLAKLVSRQKTRRKIRPQPKRWSPPRNSRSFPSDFKSNSFSGGTQPIRNNYVSSSNSFTKSTPGKSNLYTDFSRPIPLMETVVQCPLPNNNNFQSSFTPMTSPSTLSRRLKDEVTNPSMTVNQSVNNYKTIEDLRCKVLNDNTASVINKKPKPKTVELKSSKLSERLKITSPPILPPSINNNNGRVSTPDPSIFNVPQVAPKIAPSFETPDPRKELEIRANVLNLSPPIYKMYSKKEKHSNKITIYASVKVGMHTFHTFPEDAVSEEEAEKIAARLALVNLVKESSSPEVTTDDAELIKKRILNIITRHHSGVFMHLLPECYNEQYGEALPHNWQMIIEKCEDLNQEKGVGDSTILCRSGPTLKRAESSPKISKNIPENILPSNDKIQLSPIGPAAPDTLPVPEASIWQVYTTYVVSTVEIWVRLGDEHNEFVDMTNEMTKHYNQINKSVSPVACVLNNFYAVLEENYWHRVQCIDFNNETGIATVFFIDEGYEEQYKSDDLHSLDKKFCILPRQAIRVGLQGLKDFRDCTQMVTEIENHLIVDRLFYVKVHGMDADEYSTYASVTFYDTSKEEDVNVNQVLLDKILQEMAVAFKIHTGQLVELYITHIDDGGKIYAQLNTLAKTILNSENTLQTFTNNMKNTVRAINFTKMYLVKWDSQWHRARVIDIPDEQEVMVFLVDVGRTVLISRKDIFHMDKLSNALQCIPPQAMQIFLHNVDQTIYKRLVTRFRELVSDTDLLLAKVIRITASGIPIVEIFKRIGPNNMLASINTSLTYDDEQLKANEDNNNNKTKKRLERKSSRVPESVGKLNPPIISDIGHYFDVHVTLVAHPGHFIVQPLNNAGELKTMMIDLQKCYQAKGDDSPPLEFVSEGKLYAGKFRDDWYRVYVTNIISDNDVSVYFCDFGDVTIISRSSLQPLMTKFLKLPYQAVKAKLVGIEPMNVDWTVTDCVKFKDLVLEKDFVSVIVESVFDHLSPVNGTMLGLRLIDVSTDKDIYIDKLLVDEKRAKYIEGFEGLPP